jgi:hypothetical protein
MKTLNQITQSHLSILVLDKNSHNPIARMPVYAEISLIETKPPYTISPNDLSIHLEPQVANVVRGLLPLHLDEPQFRSLSPELVEKLLNRIVTLLTGDQNPFQHPEQEWKAIIDKAIIQALTELDLPTTNQVVKQAIYSYPLGYLATDHVGYASFDLTKFPEDNILDNSNFNTPSKREYAVFVYPMGKDGSRLDILEQARLTKNAIFAKLSIEPPVFEVDLKALNLPSMQKPSLVDWYFSPGSFASKPEFLVGEDGCEQLFPAQLALQQFNFRQVVRVGKAPDGFNIPREFKFGYVDEYRTSWYSLGHSLGEILYSLPLAPGESVKLAVIDWSWDSLTKRDETTKLSEEVLHQTHRDRTITETVKATLEEWQRGGSFMSGMAVSASIPLGNVLISGANSLGGAYSTSSGSRDLAAENVQRLSDGFSQASSAQREINSTVVIQARQEEKESIQTRTFTNYNHSHTLTILYYEVLRHFKVEVEWVRRRPALLKKSSGTINFKDNGLVLLYRPVIEPNLLDPSLKAGFDAIEKLEQEIEFYAKNNIIPGSRPRPFSEGDIIFDLFEFGIKTSSEIPDASIIHTDTGRTDEIVTINVVIRNRALNKTERIELSVFKKITESEERNTNVGNRFNYADPMYSFFARAGQYQTILWRDLIGFEFILHDNDEWTMERLWINAFHAGGVVNLIENHEAKTYFPKNGSSNSYTFIRRPASDALSPEPIKTTEQNLSNIELHQIKKLKDHLTEFAAYYQRFVQLSKTTEQIAIEFEGDPKWKVGTDETELIDHVEPFPLEVFGSYVAYPLIEEGVVTAQFMTDLFNAIHSNDPEQQRRAIGMLADLNKQQTEQVATAFAMKKAKAEKLITLPTRGVFAEGKLGHCNISEEIDNTRYWKWEEHPIPFEAPDINPVTPVTPQPQQTNIAPTAFPTSLVNIVNPSPAPDPTGLSDALKVLATPNIFRDMSGRTEVADLLKKLSDNTIGFQEAANKAKEIQNKYGTDLAGIARDREANSLNAAAEVAKAIAANKPSSSTESKLKNCRDAQGVIENLPPGIKKPIYNTIQKQVEKALTANPFSISFTGNFGGIATRPGLGERISHADMSVRLTGIDREQLSEASESVSIQSGTGLWLNIDSALRTATISINIDPTSYSLPNELSQSVKFPGGVFDGVSIPSTSFNRQNKPPLSRSASYVLPAEKTVLQLDLTAILSLKQIDFTLTLTAGVDIGAELEVKLSAALELALKLATITSGIEFTPKITSAVKVGANLEVKYSVDVITLDPHLGISSKDVNITPN